MKTVVMHQPNYLPWLGLFSRIKHADCFVIADSIKYTKHGLTNRNKVRTNMGWSYLTIPLSRKNSGLKICDVLLPSDKSWMEVHWKTIQYSYVQADFLSLYRDFFKELYQKDFQYLWQINEEIILYLLKCFDINIEVIKGSELNIDPDIKKTDLLIALLKSVNADIYLSGPSGRNYIEFDKFSKNNIGLKFFKFQHPIYKQRYPGFEPNMAAIDLLFNVGPQSAEIIKTSGAIED